MCYLSLLFLISASPRNVLSGKEQGETVTTSWAAFFVFFLNFRYVKKFDEKRKFSFLIKLLNIPIIRWVQLTGL